MRIKVDKVYAGNTGTIIYFTNDFGSATAFWMGDRPKPGLMYNVEVDINEPVNWSEDVQETKSARFALKDSNESILIVGILESVDDDGYTVLRIGDYIIPFMATGIHPQIGSRIKICTRSVTLSPYGYANQSM